MKVLITGATGLLGKSLVETNDSHSITGIYVGNYSVADNGAEYHAADICDEQRISGIAARGGIDVVIHAAGAADVDFCEKNYDAAYRSNVVGTKNMIELCRRTGARLVYISTNAVFDGRNAPYRETDPVSPINKYGRMKVECEELVRASSGGHLIIRPILMYGWNLSHERKNLVTALLDQLPSGKTVNMVTDVRENPLYARQCAEAIWTLLKKEKSGVYHAAGGEIVNRYEYAIKIAEAFGLDKRLIKPVDSSFFPQIAPRPKDTSYITEKLEKDTGIRPMKLKEGLEDMKKYPGGRR